LEILGGFGEFNSDNNKIINSQFNNNASQGIVVIANNTLIEGCILAGNSDSGVQIQGIPRGGPPLPPPSEWVPVTGNIIRDCDIRDNGHGGILLNVTENTYLLDNSIMRSGLFDNPPLERSCLITLIIVS